MIVGEDKKADRVRLLQDCNRFLLNHVNQDMARTDGGSPITALLGTTTWTESICQECRHESTRRQDTLLFDLLYPPDLHQSQSPPPTFTELLASSMLKETHTKTWCEQCQSYKVRVRVCVFVLLPIRGFAACARR